MNIILYAEPAEKAREKLEKLIRAELPGLQVDRVDSIQSLSQKLCRPLNRISVIVIFLVSESGIAPLLTLKPLFDHIRLILVLPDKTKRLTALGLQLGPCFISYWDNSLEDITAVLKKIDQRTS